MTLFNKTVDGIQYFIQINWEKQLEFSFENVNPLVGSGWTFDLTTDLSHNKQAWDDIAKIFGLSTMIETYAWALTLDKISLKEIESRSSKIYLIFHQQLELIRKERLFPLPEKE